MLKHSDALNFDALPTEEIEQANPLSDQYRHEVDWTFIQPSSPQELLHTVFAPRATHTFVTGGGSSQP